MFQGVLALLERSLRLDARSWPSHLARLGLMAAIYVSLISVSATSFRFGAPGLRFFNMIAWLNIIFLTLLGISFFSTVITEEKEEDTLGLMQMAGISSVGILLGKLGGRLFQALLLIAVQYPFTLLAVTFGGVKPLQVQCTFVGLASYMLLMAGLGLLCSTISPRNRTASALMILGLLAYFVVPYSARETQRLCTENGVLIASSPWMIAMEWVASTCLFLEIGEIMTTGFGESVWRIQSVSNLAASVFLFMASWGLFGVCNKNPATESASRGLLTVKRGLFRWFSPGRPRWNPFLWKDFHFVGGGVGTMLVRFAIYLGLLVVCFVLNEYVWMSAPGRFPNEVTIAMYQVLSLLIVTFDIAILAARTLNDEVRGQTLATLSMLPTSMVSTTYSKFAGTLLAGIPGPLCLAVASFGTKAGQEHTRQFYHEAAGWFFSVHFALVPHLAMVLALYLRWGFVPLAVGLSFGSLFGWVSIFEAFRVRQNDGIVVFAALVVASMCATCHVWILFRIQTVAARG